MQILVDKDIAITKWNELLTASLYVSPFQTPAYYKFFNSVKGNSANVFAVEIDQKLTCLVVVTIQKEKGIITFLTARAIIYDGPLIVSNAYESLDHLLKYIIVFYKKHIIYFEIRNGFDYSPFDNIFSSLRFKYNQHYNIKLSLNDYTIDKVLQRMKYNRRREIKMSYKEGANVNEAENKEEVFDLYLLLKKLYIEKVKLPLPDYNFFEALYNNNCGKVFVVKHNDKIIGGSFCIYRIGSSISTLYYVGNRNYQKKIFPTHLAIIGAIEFALKNKLKMLDFMGAGIPGVSYPVRDYKMQFGGKLVEYGRYVKINKPLLYFIGKMGVKVLGWVRSFFRVTG